MEIWYTITGNIDVITAQHLIVWGNDQLFNHKPGKLRIFLSSTGGDLDSATRIYFYLKSLPIEVEIIGFGQIDSAANIIFVSSRNRKALKGTRFMLHEGTYTSGNTVGRISLHEESLKVFNAINKQVEDILSLETGKTISEIKSAMAEVKMLTPEEAVEFGLASEVIEKLPLVKEI
jgi:ATP-dependent Clp protease protease subunit